MLREQLIQLIDTARALTPCTVERTTITDAATAADRLIAWCESQKAVAAQTLRKTGVSPEVALAGASRSDARDVERVIARSDTVQAAPVFGEALADGQIAAIHVDHLSRSLRRLDGHQRATLLADTPRLVALAAQSTPEEFARALRTEERRLATDDGMARLESQRAAVRLTRRTDLDSGMNIFTLSLDPVSGLKLHNQINAATEALFHDRVPKLCPSDPVEKQSFLRAHALLNILEGKGIRLSRPEAIFVIDATAPDPATGGPTIDWGLPVEIPHRVLPDLLGRADTHTVVVRNGVVIHASGAVDLGRTTRLANRAQRRALRALYPTCAIPGCCTRFELCKIHHVVWWRKLGRTDLCNLLPICVKHHTQVHNAAFDLTLAPDRILTITYPDGSTMTTGPPRRVAA